MAAFSPLLSGLQFSPWIIEGVERHSPSRSARDWLAAHRVDRIAPKKLPYGSDVGYERWVSSHLVAGSSARGRAVAPERGGVIAPERGGVIAPERGGSRTSGISRATTSGKDGFVTSRRTNTSGRGKVRTPNKGLTKTSTSGQLRANDVRTGDNEPGGVKTVQNWSHTQPSQVKY